MEQQYKTDSEIYAVLEREIIDLTLRPGCSLSENPLCARFGAPRSLIRVVLQRLQENGLVKIVPYKGTTVTRLNRDIVDELIYERIAVEARVLRDFAPHCTPEHRALIRQRAAAYDELAKAETLDFNRLYEADTRLHETWFSAMGKMYLWRTLQNAHADYSRFRMLDTLTTGGLAEVVADHHNLIDAIERCDLAAFEPLVERHLYGGIRRLGSKLTEEYADYFEGRSMGDKKAPLHKCAGALLFFSAHDAGNENFKTDADEDDAAEDGGFAGELGAELFADGKAGFTDEEGDGRHDEGADQCHEPAVLRDGEAHRQRVDAGGDALHEECARAQLSGFLGLFALDALNEHFAADIAQQDEGDPGDELFKRREQLHDGVDADPARHGHDGLKDAEGACDLDAPAAGHLRVMQTVCHRDGKRIHGKAHTQQGAVEEKQKTPFHNDAS